VYSFSIFLVYTKYYTSSNFEEKIEELESFDETDLTLTSLF